MKILVTGGCGFIGSHFIRMLLDNPSTEVVNLDALTYAGKPENLADLAEKKSYKFEKGNICDQKLVAQLFQDHAFTSVVNFAAESHVDNSILGPRVFEETNCGGTLNLLDCAYRFWSRQEGWQEKYRFLQVSTDEVYGSLPERNSKLKFTEKTFLNPSSAYSASKAGADLMTLAYATTFGMPVLISRCSNNYGSFQDREKFIPTMILQAMKDQKLPVYGDGCNVRDWIHVADHCRAVKMILEQGRVGEIYNVGSSNEWKNIDIVRLILKIIGKKESLISFVKDRLGHDRRYAIDSSKIQKELGWKAEKSFEEGMKDTIRWYLENK